MDGTGEEDRAGIILGFWNWEIFKFVSLHANFPICKFLNFKMLYVGTL